VQTGSPKDLFERPNTTFVGYFIGSPAMNLFESEVASETEVKVGDIKIKTSTNLSKVKNKNIKLGIRSEFIDLADKEGNNTVKAKVQKVEDFGNFKLLTATMKNFTIKSKIEREKPISNDEVNLYIPAEKCCVYEDEKLI